MLESAAALGRCCCLLGAVLREKEAKEGAGGGVGLQCCFV